MIRPSNLRREGELVSAEVVAVAPVQVDLLDDISSDSPAVCGGIMNVFIDPWWKGAEETPKKDERVD